MRRSEHIAIGLSTVMLMGNTAGAVDVGEFVGTWGGDAFRAYDCKGAPGSEIMPVTVSRGEGGEISVGAYAWQCSAAKWEERGPFLWADTTCGNEGSDEVSNERLELALSNAGQLVLVRGGNVDVFTRCRAEAR